MLADTRRLLPVRGVFTRNRTRNGADSGAVRDTPIIHPRWLRQLRESRTYGATFITPRVALVNTGALF